MRNNKSSFPGLKLVPVIANCNGVYFSQQAVALSEPLLSAGPVWKHDIIKRLELGVDECDCMAVSKIALIS